MNNITLTPTGDILIDGIKVGEWYKRNGYIKYTVQTDNTKESFYAKDVLLQLNYNITNGFTPKKFEK